MHQDPHLVVVAKPFGWASQRTRKGQDGVIEWLQSRHPTASLHHRLDQPASGLMVFALSAEGRRHLAACFSKHRVERTYLAVCSGRPTSQSWDAPVDGKAARTHVEVLSHRNGFSALRLRLETGRKHQIRLHAAGSGHALVGDRRYGAELGRAWPRLALHAHRLALPSVHGADLSLACPLPADLVSLWHIAGGPAMDAPTQP